MSEKTFFVVGGEYADTSFTSPAEGKELETHGPFSQQEAHTFWRSVTGQTVDNAMVRYFVKSAEDMGTAQYYVVGGEYADTSFSAMASISGAGSPARPLIAACIVTTFRPARGGGR
jgi:hypothetical protein